MAILFYPQNFCQKSAERKSLKKYFFLHISFWYLTWNTNPDFTSNKPTYYLLSFYTSYLNGDHNPSVRITTRRFTTYMSDRPTETSSYQLLNSTSISEFYMLKDQLRSWNFLTKVTKSFIELAILSIKFDSFHFSTFFFHSVYLFSNYSNKILFRFYI